MANVRKTANKPVQRVRDFTTATKMLITGNGSGAIASRLRKDIDSFIDDLEAFDAAVWKVVHQNKERLYKFLDMLAERGSKKSDGPVNELKTAWKKLATSGETLGHDVAVAAKELGKKANPSNN